jgi:lipid A ethanolaminephosphotransferase
MMQTDMKETKDLLSLKQVLYFILLGLVPAYIIYKAPIKYASVKTELLNKLKQSSLLFIL